MEVTDKRNGDLLEHTDVVVPLYLLQHVWDTDSRGNVFKNTPYVKVLQCDNSLWRNSSVMLLLPLYPSNHNTLLQPAVSAPRREGCITNGVERKARKGRKRSWKPRNVMRHERTQPSHEWSSLLSVPRDGWSKLKLWRWFGLELQHQYELQGDVHATVEGHR